MDIHVPIRVLRFLQPYIEKLGPFIEDIIRLVEPFAPKFAQTLGKISQNWPIIVRDPWIEPLEVETGFEPTNLTGNQILGTIFFV